MSGFKPLFHIDEFVKSLEFNFFLDIKKITSGSFAT
jgi:hypothetical protein